VAAADHGSFRRAADALLLRQSTLSRCIADSDDVARVYRFDLAQNYEMISPTIPI
jgi:hypothetical protein